MKSYRSLPGIGLIFCLLAATFLQVLAFCGCGGGQVDACKDECSRRGARACDEQGLKGYQVCADEWDQDDCLEWGPVNACEADQTCLEGICQGGQPACRDECGAGDLRCAAAPDNGVEACGDFDDDDCLEWGGYQSCAQGDCAAGACPGECSDECQPEGEKACEGDGHVVCGDQDADGCLEWSDAQDCGEHQTCEKHGRCCIEADEDCEDYDECCDCYHCCPVFKICVPNFWDSDCI
jgi:hypothetical protein